MLKGYINKKEFVNSFNFNNKSILGKIYDLHKEFEIII